MIETPQPTCECGNDLCIGADRATTGHYYRLYEREKAAREAAEARAEKEHATARGWSQEAARLESARAEERRRALEDIRKVTNITAPMRICVRCSIAVASSPVCPECKGLTLTGPEIRLAIIGAIDGMPRCDGACGETTRLSHIHRGTAIWRALKALDVPGEGQEYKAWSARFPHLCQRGSADHGFVSDNPLASPASAPSERVPTEPVGLRAARDAYVKSDGDSDRLMDLLQAVDAALDRAAAGDAL